MGSAGLSHATLTEDEDVLRGALSVGPGDRCLALHARGNGDAAFVLLLDGPAWVEVADLFDPDGLAYQLELKVALVRSLEPVLVRRLLGLEPGLERAARAAHLDPLIDRLPAAARGYWRARRALLLPGIALTDDTRRLGRLLVRLAPVARALGRWPRLLSTFLRLTLVTAPLYFPREERLHSPGYRRPRRAGWRHDPRDRTAHRDDRRGGNRRHPPVLTRRVMADPGRSGPGRSPPDE